MKRAHIGWILILPALCIAGGLFGCSRGDAQRAANSNNVIPGAPAPEPKDGDYPADGTITKINLQLGSVEIDHGNVPGLMPAMRMEFYVSDKALLDGLAVGDHVDFVIYYKQGTETITKINKKSR